MKRVIILTITVIIVFVMIIFAGITVQNSKLTGKTIERTTVEETTEYEPVVFFCPRDNCPEKVVQILQTATKSIHCAFYDMDQEDIIRALEEKKGLDVRIVNDLQTIIDNKNIQRIKGLNISNKDKPMQLMHNKFCVIDGEVIFTGSYNPTKRDSYYNNNNVIAFQSKYLSENYEAEFQELWKGQFGGGDLTPYPVVIYNGKRVENYFCPEDGCEEAVIKTLEKAKEEIKFMTFSFTSDEIENALIERYDAGIKVEGVLEKSQKNEWNAYDLLKEKGIDVKWDKNKHNMHHKVFIIDKKIVITGSFNPTKNGDENNDENILIIEDEKIAGEYLKEYDRVSGISDIVDQEAHPTNTVVISEVYYDTKGKDSEEEFVELYNPTSNEIELEGWYLTNNKTRYILTGNIKPKGIIVYQKLPFSLPNNGGMVVLSDGYDQQDMAAWEGLWKFNAPTGTSIQRKEFTNANDPAQWFTAAPSKGKI